MRLHREWFNCSFVHSKGSIPLGQTTSTFRKGFKESENAYSMHIVGIIPQDLCISHGLQVVELKPHVPKTLARSEQGLVLELSKQTRQIHVEHQCTKKHV
jgi:hypothetical protein